MTDYSIDDPLSGAATDRARRKRRDAGFVHRHLVCPLLLEPEEFSTSMKQMDEVTFRWGDVGADSYRLYLRSISHGDYPVLDVFGTEATVQILYAEPHVWRVNPMKNGAELECSQDEQAISPQLVAAQWFDYPQYPVVEMTGGETDDGGSPTDMTLKIVLDGNTPPGTTVTVTLIGGTAEIGTDFEFPEGLPTNTLVPANGTLEIPIRSLQVPGVEVGEYLTAQLHISQAVGLDIGTRSTLTVRFINAEETEDECVAVLLDPFDGDNGENIREHFTPEGYPWAEFGEILWPTFGTDGDWRITDGELWPHGYPYDVYEDFNFLKQLSVDADVYEVKVDFTINNIAENSGGYIEFAIITQMQGIGAGYGWMTSYLYLGDVPEDECQAGFRQFAGAFENQDEELWTQYIDASGVIQTIPTTKRMSDGAHQLRVRVDHSGENMVMGMYLDDELLLERVFDAAYYAFTEVPPLPQRAGSVGFTQQQPGNSDLVKYQSVQVEICSGETLTPPTPEIHAVNWNFSNNQAQEYVEDPSGVPDGWWWENEFFIWDDPGNLNVPYPWPYKLKPGTYHVVPDGKPSGYDSYALAEEGVEYPAGLFPLVVMVDEEGHQTVEDGENVYFFRHEVGTNGEWTSSIYLKTNPPSRQAAVQLLLVPQDAIPTVQPAMGGDGVTYIRAIMEWNP